jgi:hypothetical protein
MLRRHRSPGREAVAVSIFGIITAPEVIISAAEAYAAGISVPLGVAGHECNG